MARIVADGDDLSDAFVPTNQGRLPGEPIPERCM
jgi:hypothetical protein